MSEAESRVDIIRLPSTFAEPGTKIKTMRQQFKDVQHAGELDAATKNLGFPAFLLNFYLATSVNLSPIGLEAAVHIPVQITEREGGRKSLYDLAQGEQVLAGIYVT